MAAMAGHLVKVREILYSAPSRRAWDDLCDLFEAWPVDDPELALGIDYAEGLLASWPDNLRAARGRWSEGLFTFLGQLAPDQAPAPPPHWVLVRKMSLDTGHISQEGFRALGSSPYLGPLTALRMGTDPRQRDFSLTSEMIADLVRWPSVGQLHTLDLSFNAIDGHGALRIAAATHLIALRHLDLSTNLIDDEGARALAAAPHLGQLQSLDLNRNPISDEGRRALLDSPHLCAAIKDRFERTP